MADADVIAAILGYRRVLYCAINGTALGPGTLLAPFDHPVNAIAYAISNNLFDPVFNAETEVDDNTSPVMVFCLGGTYPPQGRIGVPELCTLAGPESGSRAIIETNQPNTGGVNVYPTGPNATVQDLDFVNVQVQSGDDRSLGIGFDILHGQNAYDNFNIRRCRFKDYEADAAYFKLTTGAETFTVTIEDCHFLNIKGDCIFMVGGGGLVSPGSRLILRRNTIYLRGPNGITDSVSPGSIHYNSAVTVSFGIVEAYDNRISVSTGVDTRGNNGTTSAFWYIGFRPQGNSRWTLGGNTLEVDGTNVYSATTVWDIHFEDTASAADAGLNSWRESKINTISSLRRNTEIVFASDIETSVTGTGAYSVNHNGGVGASGASMQVAIPYTGTLTNTSAGCMTFTSNGTTGVAGVSIRAYLVSDFDATPRVEQVLAETTTTATGTWVSDLNLNSGTYYIKANTVGDPYQENKIKLYIP